MKVTHPACGKSWSGQRREHCPVCCQTFNSTNAGDMHRAGPFMPRSARRCMNVAEMLAKGMFERDGVWYGPDRNADSRPRTAPQDGGQDRTQGAVTPQPHDDDYFDYGDEVR